MSSPLLHAVTGAFGYSGRCIAQRLLARGSRVRTLTNSPSRARDLAGRVEVFPLAFDRPASLADSLRGVDTLFNTYWVRFNHRQFCFGQAVGHTLTLFEAARSAGVRRIVHVSITRPSEDSPFEYFRGKARLERALCESGIPYAILRPAVLFGGADILINNIAWMLRRLPLFGVFGDGAYRVQPIHVEDFADLALHAAAREDNVTIDAVGPETFTFRELVAAIAGAIGVRRPIVSCPAWAGYALAVGLGWALRDVVLTWEEVGGLMADLLHGEGPPTGTTRLTDWARANADQLGREYASELARRRR